MSAPVNLAPYSLKMKKPPLLFGGFCDLICGFCQLARAPDCPRPIRPRSPRRSTSAPEDLVMWTLHTNEPDRLLVVSGPQISLTRPCVESVSYTHLRAHENR